jgi:glutamyl-Q tRNA(Asp) synthetase
LTKSRKSKLVAPDTADNPLFPPTHRYRGRFAPSPTGPLHIGSIIAAVASYLDARAVDGIWLVRMEDLDPPREQPGAADDILRTLESLGLHWDEHITYQSQRLDAYRTALEQLKRQGLIFACQCSRQELADSLIYPGTCLQHIPRPDVVTALRCRVPDEIFSFEDRLQGHYRQNLAHEVGDFVLQRKDGYFAYQLAVVVDDGWQRITDIVRGMDLLDSTPRQLYLQRKLSLPAPRYAHIPVIINALGQKLGKQQHAAAIDARRPGQTLVAALKYLQQQPDPALAHENAATVLQWASAHWRPAALADLQQLPEQLDS